MIEIFSFERLPDASELRRRHGAALVALAQHQYEMAGEDGGACARLNRAMCGYLQAQGLCARVVELTPGRYSHIVVRLRDGVFMLDIPYQYYEHGSGPIWPRRAGVCFERSQLCVTRLDAEPGTFERYVDEDTVSGSGSAAGAEDLSLRADLAAESTEAR